MISKSEKAISSIQISFVLLISKNFGRTSKQVYFHAVRTKVEVGAWVVSFSMYIFSCRRATIHIPLSVSQSVSGHNSASAGARKLKFGMKDACSRISRPFFHFFKFPIF